ncbi:MAG: flagellar export chaperone FliS [Candidatus Raymondbacteria bacterium RifOxyB12_full_50_8]|uniref:Flagellar secretion chaperone FliS n=1 Tax=Candidatus Raymondbacteria bacterium RIFOXYD12_FULL_49_13 TaxID=1817890 RepID=A0A1F7FIR6_UNCRA|nr:MAG: flagellar export chaperone FliS [Candidatus Raymondbacteria bacterium RIFOXYA2_FULL_49_16]OGJ94700.1 MAG: flagellar export chaperone FliS [Candidatus Raymondbacteria bacterium RifOxyB12_full_50_8]OGK06352.1 MAG: flagellar export chaperone FliS [Candidatus Raymondbacteria bacterium RIFOXYD12_FULL_49_13]OGP40686.1 MAG: flagellar export chaperone FliS [Candidatus Raymondbacteria bacterium RIFOXYB2_FULL_49_35]
MVKNSMYNSYKTANVNTTDQGKLIVICYDVAIKACTQAKELLAEKKIVEKSKKIYKAQDAITELMVSLNMEKGGAFAKRLFALYDYFNWRLSEANIKLNTAMIEEVMRHLKSLRDAWVVAAEKVRKDTHAPMVAPALATAAASSDTGKAFSLRLVG